MSQLSQVCISFVSAVYQLCISYVSELYQRCITTREVDPCIRVV